MSNGKQSTYVDPEDMFNDSRMSFGDHLEELRTHLWRAVKGFILAMIIALCIGKYVVEFVTAPVEQQLQAFYERTSAQKYKEYMAAAQKEGFSMSSRRFEWTVDKNELREATDLPPLPESAKPALTSTVQAFERVLDQLDLIYLIDSKDLAKDGSRAVLHLTTKDPGFENYLKKIAHQYGRPQRVSTFNVTEAFMVYFKVSLVTGLIIGSPWIFYQIWSFVAAGLYPHEKKYVNHYLPFSVGLFLAGAALCQFFVMPKAIEVLLSFNDWMGLEPDMRLNEWLSFALMMPLIFGISFQTPLVMLFLYKLGILEVSSFRRFRKIAWFLMAVFAAVITPTPDAMTMMFLWIPMGLLYELGILLCAWQPHTPFEDVDQPEAEEMVEV
jgi:sec-independent protein translocase protein TatC